MSSSLFKLPAGSKIERRVRDTYNWYSFVTTKAAYYSRRDLNVSAFNRDDAVWYPLSLTQSLEFDSIVFERKLLTEVKL